MPLAHPRKSSARRKESRLNLRTSAQQNTLIRKAAASLGKNVTEFLLDAGLAAAAETLSDRRHFVLDETRWKAFLKALDRPAVERPRLKKLLTTPSVIERS